ncbi:MAG TPA: DUF1801 domain-containing protein [Acidimicrobiia bacterium]|nr:DUF1801 domain-containing protein [Acidimicrobiia bacterium]
MPSNEIDTYLGNLDEPARSTLEDLRRVILDIVPDAEQGMSYGVPAFRSNGKAIAGFAAYRSHLSYLPHSGTVLETLAAEVSGYATSKGALQFPIDSPLDRDLVAKLIAARQGEISGS